MGTSLKVISLTQSSSRELIEKKFGNAILHYFSLQSIFDGVNQDGIILLADDDKIYTAFVIDGMGGHQSGEMATAKVLESCEKHLTKLNIQDQRLAILDILEHAGHEIKELKVGAGATITAVELGNDYVRFYNAGDAFGLLVGARGKLKFKTIEHSPLGFGIEAGIVERHDDKIDSNEVSNGLGFEPLRIEISEKVQLKNNDLICLGSDGILNSFKISELIETITEGEFDGRMSNLLMTLIKHQDKFLQDDTTLLLIKSYLSE